MATRTIPAVTETTDDFTGKTVTADDKPVQVSITLTVGGKPVNGNKPYVLDAANAMAEVLTRFLADPSDENRRALGSVIPRPAMARAGSGTGATDKAGTTKRDWLKANGSPDIGPRGKFTAEQDDQWAKHLANESKTATA